MKKINQLKTQEDINEYYAHYQDEIRIRHKITNLEMPTINSYIREHEKLINKCGERLKKIKNGYNPDELEKDFTEAEMEELLNE